MPSKPYPQLRMLGSPMALNTGGKPIPPAPKWANALTGLIGGMGQAVTAPGNALMGNYNQVGIGPDGSVTPFDPRMVQDASTLAGMTTLGAGAAPAQADALNMGIRAFHGSPHSFDKFSMDKIGTGEGAQAYGHGLYFAENEGVAQSYRDALKWKGANWDDPSYVAGFWKQHFGGDATKAATYLQGTLGKQTGDAANAAVSDAINMLKTGAEGKNSPNPGAMYAVDINAEPSHMLDWDAPLASQPKTVQDAIQQHVDAINAERAGIGGLAEKMFPATDWADQIAPRPTPTTGQQAYDLLSSHLGNAGAAKALKDSGLKGIQYLDSGSRAAGNGSRNYVVFDDNLINVLKKYGIAAPVAGGALAAGMRQQPQAVNQLTMPAQQPVNPLLGQIGT